MSSNAFHRAAKEGNLAYVRSQVGNIYIDTKDGYGRTALHWAVIGGHKDIAKLLIINDAALSLDDVSIPTIDVICIFLSLISILHPPSYTPRHVLLSRVVDVPPPTTQHDIQYYSFLSTFSPIPYLHYGSPVSHILTPPTHTLTITLMSS